MNYEPNVLPVAVGGYYWVFFASRSTCGNVIAPSGVLPLSDKPFGTAETGPRKKIWVAAVDIDYHGKLDPSHPAFYLPGQGLASGNMRAFASLAGVGPTVRAALQTCSVVMASAVQRMRPQPTRCSSASLRPTTPVRVKTRPATRQQMHQQALRDDHPGLKTLCMLAMPRVVAPHA